MNITMGHRIHIFHKIQDMPVTNVKVYPPRFGFPVLEPGRLVRSPPTTTAGPGRRPVQPHGWYGASYKRGLGTEPAPRGAVFSSGMFDDANESRSSTSPVIGSQ